MVKMARRPDDFSAIINVELIERMYHASRRLCGMIFIILYGRIGLKACSPIQETVPNSVKARADRENVSYADSSAARDLDLGTEQGFRFSSESDGLPWIVQNPSQSNDLFLLFFPIKQRGLFSSRTFVTVQKAKRLGDNAISRGVSTILSGLSLVYTLVSTTN